MILTDKDKEFIRDNCSDPDELLRSTDVNYILDAIDDCIDENGFAPPDYYDYNDFGRKAQKVYDRIFENNCTD